MQLIKEKKICQNQNYSDTMKSENSQNKNDCYTGIGFSLINPWSWLVLNNEP